MGPATELYLAPTGSLSTAAAPGASPGTTFTTAQLLFSLSRSAELTPLPLLGVVPALGLPFAEKTSGHTMTSEDVGQGLTVMDWPDASGPTSCSAEASLESSTG